MVRGCPFGPSPAVHPRRTARFFGNASRGRWVERARRVFMKLATLAAVLAFATPALASPRRPHAWVYQMGGWPGRLGAQIADMTEDLRKYFGAPADSGVLVTHVDADQPAAKAGLKVGDVIIEAAGQKVEDPSDVI